MNRLSDSIIYRHHSKPNGDQNHQARRSEQLQEGDRETPLTLLDAVQPSFVPAVLEASSSPPVRRQRNMLRREVESNAGMIDVALDGITVRIGPEAPAATIAAVLRALRVGT